MKYLIILTVLSYAYAELEKNDDVSFKFAKLVLKRIGKENQTETISLQDFGILATKFGLQNVPRNSNFTIAHTNDKSCCPDCEEKALSILKNEMQTSDDVLKCFNLNTSISPSEFQFICPALVYSFLTLKDHHLHSHVQIYPQSISAKQYIYGIISTGIVCLASMIGIFLFPLMPKSYYSSLTSFMSSLAVGTLAGDALLHLIPHAYGLHSHGATSDHNCDHEHEEECQGGYLVKTLVVIAGIYLFYLIDVITSKLPGGQGASHHHHHNHKAPAIRPASCTKNNDQLQNKSLSNYVDDEDEEIEAMNGENDVKITTGLSTNIKHSWRTRAGNFFRSVKYVQRYAWVVLIADSVHNVSDGVTIGAAFGVNVELGFTTSLAVLLHELPHELGDYAILVTSGFTHLQALFFNLITAMTAYVGLLIGFLLSSRSDATQQWTLAAAAGIFLYVALVDLFPLLVPSADTSNCDVVLHNAGLLLGFATMFLLAAYEDKIKF